MAAYENLPGFVGKIFKLSIYLEKPSKPVVQKIITKVSSVPAAAVNAQLNCVASWRAFWNKKRGSLRSQIAAAC
jgi:hypothetical protein